MNPSENTSEIAPCAPVEAEVSLLDLLHVVVVNLRLLLGGPLLAGLIALAISFALTPTFTASTTFVPPQSPVGTVSALKSRAVLDALVARFDLVKRYEQKSLPDAAKALEQHARAKQGKDGVITVDVEDEDPEFAAALANAHVEELGTLLRRMTATEARQRRLYFESLLAATKSNLSAAERALGAKGLSADVLKSSTKEAVEVLARLQAAIAAQETKLVSMRSYLAESAVEFRQAQSDMVAMRAQYAQSESAAPAPAIGGDVAYTTRYREFKYQQALLELLSRQYETARLDESRDLVVIQVLDPAVASELKSKPKRAQIAALVALGTGFVLLLFVFIRQGLRGANTDVVSAQKLHRLRRAWRISLGLERGAP